MITVAEFCISHKGSWSKTSARSLLSISSVMGWLTWMWRRLACQPWRPASRYWTFLVIL